MWFIQLILFYDLHFYFANHYISKRGGALCTLTKQSMRKLNSFFGFLPESLQHISFYVSGEQLIFSSRDGLPILCDLKKMNQLWITRKSMVNNMKIKEPLTVF